jgi:hypothetical protein
MFYVTMTDKALSGWGKAQGKTNKLVIECETFQEASIVESYALRRNEMKYINIRTTRPGYPSSTHYTQFKDKTEYAAWFRG